MEESPCLISPQELLSTSSSQNNNNAQILSPIVTVPSAEELRKIELEVHPLVHFNYFERFESLETHKALAERACLQRMKQSFGDALEWATKHENDPYQLEPLPPFNEIEDVVLRSKLKKLNEKYHQEIPSNEKELQTEEQDNLTPLRHGSLDYIGNSYCVQNPITRRIYVVQYYYTVPDEYSYSFPLEEKQIKYAFHYEPVSNTRDTELQYSLRGIYYLGSRINPYSTDYVMSLKPPSIHKTVMTFLARPDERWTLFFAKPPPGIVQQNDVKISVEIAKMGKNAFNIEIKDEFPFTELTPTEFIPLPFSATLCQLEVEPTKDFQVVAVTQEWVWTQRFLSKRGRTRIPLNILKNPQISQEERNFFLNQDNIRYTFRDPAFEEWLYEGNLILDKERKYTSDELVVFGSRVLHWVSESIPYTAKEKYRGCGKGGVAYCARPKIRKTDCGGKALMVAAAMRFNNIPARVIQGQFSQYDPNFFQERLAHMTSEEGRMGFHAMSEYWIDELGWVPVEATDWRGVTFGRDRNKTMFVRHYDFIPTLHFRSKNEWKTEHPYFVSAFFSVLESPKVFSFREMNRQDYMVYRTF